MQAGRVDLHCHILPGIDDGAAGLAEAEAMVRAALADGIVCLAATPHNLRWPPGTNRTGLEARVTALERHLTAQGLPITVVAGAEMALIAALPQQLDAGEFATLNRSHYLLLEPLYAGLPTQVERIIEQVQTRGYAPILAHPERGADFLRRPGLVRRLVEQGALVQITAASLEGRFGGAARHLAERLLAQNLVHVIASDAHDPDSRPPRLAKAEGLAAAIVGAERARALVAGTPAAILADRPVEVEPPSAPPRWRFLWWR